MNSIVDERKELQSLTSTAEEVSPLLLRVDERKKRGREQRLSDITELDANQIVWKKFRQDTADEQIRLSKRRLENEDSDKENYTCKRFYIK